MSYKQNASSNRDALFGPPKSKSGGGVGGPKHKREAASNRDALFGGGGSSSAKGGGNNKPKGSTSASRSSSASSSSSHTFRKPSVEAIPMPKSSSSGYNYKSKFTKSSSGVITSTLSGDAKIAKMKEADEYRNQAKKAMARGVFSRPDPIAAGTYYKKAADAYQLCGENRLERLHRIASADCQMGQGAYATAAAEYTRAADLAKVSEETLDRKRKEGWKLHGDAANAYRQMGEKGKAGKSQVLSALAFLWEDDSSVLNKQTLTFIEESIEAHVPDPLNRYSRYRQTGTSSFADPNNPTAPPNAETLELAKHHLVTSSYAHEPMVELVDILVKYREFPSALYAAGAAASILENDGIATITLSRIYVVETILTLAMGDPVAAEQNFLNVHVQKTEYLTARECKLAEDLFRAIIQRDTDALEEARSPKGSNRASLANLQASVRELVTQLRISGAARKQINYDDYNSNKFATKIEDEEEAITAAVLSEPETETPPPATVASVAGAGVGAGSESLDELANEIENEKKNAAGATTDGEQEFNADELQDELDNLMGDMGLDDEEDELDDDDIDLR